MTAENSLSWQLSWDDPASADTSPARRTSGVLTVEVGGHAVWPASEFTWTWIELLEWLANSWGCLTIEDGLPFGAVPISVPDLLRSVHRAQEFSPSGERERAEVELWDFLATHDIAQALQGARPPSIVIWREGLLAHILTETEHRISRWAPVRVSLENLGNLIYRRLDAAQGDPRADSVRRLWMNRNELTLHESLIVAGLDPLIAEQLPFGEEVRVNKIEYNELLAAARMTSGLPSQTVRTVLTTVISLGKRDTSALDAVTEQVRQAAQITSPAAPHEEGYAYAQAFRHVLGLSDEHRFDSRTWLLNTGVLYREVDLDSPAVDAFAAWGDSCGPAVIVNPRGRHTVSARGRNATLAHEIGHLLLDRDAALPAVEVLGGRVNPKVESRARAFAAEVLIPGSVAGRLLGNVGDRSGAESVVRSLSQRFGGSAEIVAWQARNSGVDIKAGVVDFLRTLVSDPQRF